MGSDVVQCKEPSHCLQALKLQTTIVCCLNSGQPISSCRGVVEVSMASGWCELVSSEAFRWKYSVVVVKSSSCLFSG